VINGKMGPKSLETRFKRTWFGLNARVTIGPGFLHKTGFHGVAIPHPAVANLLLRMGLPAYLNRNLSFAHEFAHFQTAPVLFVYMLVVFVLAYVKNLTGMGEIFLLLVSIQAAWELMCESLVVLENPAAYRRSYNGITWLPRIFFWAVGGMLTAAGWLVVLQG
jgi:hypothetical protein